MAIKHKVVSEVDWLKARKKLLVKEKKFLRMQDAMNAERRSLPWVKVTKSYVFEGPHGDHHRYRCGHLPCWLVTPGLFVVGVLRVRRGGLRRPGQRAPSGAGIKRYAALRGKIGGEAPSPTAAARTASAFDPRVTSTAAATAA